MINKMLIIFIFTFSTVCYSQNKAPVDIPASEPELFDVRAENVKLILTDKFQNDDSISIFTSAINLVVKNAVKASNTIHSLLNWETVITKKPISVAAYKRNLHFGRWVGEATDSIYITCYNTRAKVLVRDTLKPVTFKDNNCTVDTGEWLDPYSLEKLKNAADMQVDHMVPLKDAYISGAYKWTYKARCLFGNYLGYKHHLISAFGEENNQKSDQTPADYMPPNPDYKCTYLKNWLYIKAFWNLTMSTAEADAIKDLILKNKCDISKMTISEKEIAEQSLFVNQNKDLCADHLD